MNSRIAALRKKLSPKLKEVVSNTKSEFGDPWNLVAMDQMSGQRLKRKWFAPARG